MISRQELNELASLIMQDAWFVSLYLNVDPRDNPKGDWQLHYKNLVKDALKALGESERDTVRKDLDYLDRWLADRPDGMKRGLGVISCGEMGFWRAYHTSVPFRNQLVIDRDPYIKPLAATLDLYQRYLIAVVSLDGARLFLSSMGEIEELTHVESPESSANLTRDGNTGDMGIERAQRRGDNIQRRLFKDVELLIQKTIREEGLKRILLGGTSNARGRFKDAVSEALAERIVGEFNVDNSAGASDVLERATPLMKEAEFKFERKALAELFDQRGAAKSGSVIGLSDALTALQQGNVRKIFVMQNMAVAGMVCSRCGALTPERKHPCPYCSGEMLRVSFMLDLAIQKALDQGARIDMIEHSPELESSGGIGALLRY